MIQQRKRVYDLAYELVEKLVVEHCPEDRPSDDWDMNAPWPRPKSSST